jgi:photosynthetic reaction center cytochrome c subunit
MLIVLLLMIALITASTTMAGQSAPSPVERGPQEKRPAETVYKNIQVFKGLSAEELVPAMNFIAGSLGVDCDYCHEENFEADKLPAKSRAREMIRMVHRLNEEDFHSKTEITCFTCHRGQTIPSGLPVLGLRQAAAASAQARPRAEALPSVGQVLDAYVKALGGQAALDGVKSRITKTTKINSSDFKETTEVFQQAPGKVLRIVRAQGYTTWAGFNGRQTWGYDSEKSYWGLLDSAQRLSLIQESELYPGSRLRKQYAQVAVLGKERVGERETYVVGGISPEGARESFFFDIDTDMLLRRRTEQNTVLGWVPVQVDFENYRDVDGVKLPFVERWSSFRSFGLGSYEARQVLEVHQNVPIEDEKFNPPASVAQ